MWVVSPLTTEHSTVQPRHRHHCSLARSFFPLSLSPLDYISFLPASPRLRLYHLPTAWAVHTCVSLFRHCIPFPTRRFLSLERARITIREPGIIERVSLNQHEQ